MNRLLTQSCAFWSLAILMMPTLAFSQDWTDQAFPTKHHNFGTVAVASETEHLFPVINPFSTPMRFQSIRASCGCTTPTILNSVIGPGEQGLIRAKFNTDTFRGKKGATLTVVMVEPFYSEVRLKVDGYIRSDLVFHPGKIDLGKISMGSGATKSAKVLYAGRSNWRITGVRSNQPWIQPRYELASQNGGNIQYNITVEIDPQAPSGMFQDELVVETNDRNLSTVPLRVTGNVESSVTISPSAVALGSVKPAQEVGTKLVLVGKSPFVVESITAEGWNVHFDAPEVAKKMHIIRPTLRYMGDQSGPQRVPLRIKTAGDGSVMAQTLITAEIRSN